MDNQRLLLYMALGFVSLILYQTWMQDYHMPAPVAGQTGTATPATSADVPGTQDLPSSVAGGSDTAVAQPVTADKTISAPSVSVETDVMDIEISTNGATITSVQLKAIRK